MRKLSAIILVALFALACEEQGIRSFWKTHSIDYKDINAAREQFADYAELAVASPEKDAVASMDPLFNQLKKDTVAYYIYSDWIDGAFYSILSPCRSPKLYSKAVSRIVKDGMLSQDNVDGFIRKREWIQYNKVGDRATLPGVTLNGERTLVLVLDLGCPSCRRALLNLGWNEEWADLRHVAICCGFGPKPDVPGWEYFYPDNAAAVFDIHMTPVFFVVGEDGTVQTTYQYAFKQNL